MPKYRLDLKTNPSRGEFREMLARRGEQRVEAARKVKGYLKLALSVPVVVVVLYVGSLAYNHIRVVPRGVETVQDFYRRYGNPPRVDALYADGRTYYRITGEIPAPLSFPKGNPMYVFDDTGRIVDWTGESGGDPNFLQRWVAPRATQVGVSYFLEKFPPN